MAANTYFPLPEKRLWSIMGRWGITGGGEVLKSAKNKNKNGDGGEIEVHP